MSFAVLTDSPRDPTYEERQAFADEMYGGKLREWVVITLANDLTFQGNLIYYDSIVVGLTDGDGSGVHRSPNTSTYTTWISNASVASCVVNSDAAPMAACRWNASELRWMTWQDRYWVNTPVPAVRTTRRVHRNRTIRRRT